MTRPSLLLVCVATVLLVSSLITAFPINNNKHLNNEKNLNLNHLNNNNNNDDNNNNNNDTLKKTYDPCVHPVIMIPGLGASVLDYYLTDDFKHLHEICILAFPKNKWSSGLSRLWPSIESADAIPPHMLRECWEAMISLTYNATTKKFSNAPNVLVRPRDFGGIAGVANLFSFVWDYGPSFGAVYEKLANILIDKTPGYKDHLNVRGAPYDFRLLADEEYLQSSYLDLQGLIEETYEFTRDCPTGPKRIHVMTHSLGGPYYLYFLNTFVSQEWKDMYLESFLSFSTPFHGAQMAYRTAISGDSEGLPGHNYAFLPAEKIMGGLLWMIPYANIYGDQEFVQVGNRTYTAQLDDAEDSLPALFRQLPLDRSDVIDILRSIITKRTAVVEAPNTRLYCIYGSSIPTEAFDVYKDLNATTSDPDMYREPVLQNDKIILAPPSPQLLMPLNDTNPYSKDEVQGDKIVEQVSLRVCNQWVGNNGGADVFIKEFPGYHHVTMLSQQPFLDYVMAIINESNSNNNSNN